MKRWSILTALFLVLAACQQDPYKGKGDLQDPSKPKNKPTQEGEEKGALGLVVPDLMLFVEGSLGEYDIKASVPVGAVMKIEFTGLPKGMSFDATRSKLVWAPDYQAANDPNKPEVVSRQYRIKTKVYDANKPSVNISRESMIVVNDMQRPAGVKSALEMLGIEGSPFAHIIDFEDQEYPAGPFDATVSGLPLDAVLDWPNKTQPRFILRWTPGFDKVINKTDDTYTGHVIIYNPRGKRLEFNVQWTVANRIVPPIVAGPTDITQPVDVDFVVMAEDQNNEYIPQWSGTHPGYGNLTVSTQTVIGGSGRPKSMGIVSWKGIPADKLGKLVTLNLRACVQTTFCSNHQVRVLPTTMVMGNKK